MIVKKCMTGNPIIVSPLETIKNAFHLLKKNSIHQIPVVSDGRLVGIVTDRDLRMALVQDLKEPGLKVENVMSKNPVQFRKIRAWKKPLE
ncbi:CBS domain-containing protein [Desulfobacterota bacterium AH_259_B03_O07]|nr:CBS domain-containing protein [Desulfobacterota bacterium AH_259_B03_O07]